ncbi:hypothetical protein H6778_00925 [Candidatus Nomurabacteria bacterium]|nr:hypothetical protein [Candidatus Nomurabacteria bacterium]
MKLFRDYLMPWWQVGLLKLYVMVVGLIVGSYFAEYILPYMKLLLVLFVLLAIYFSHQLLTNGFKERGEV